MGFARTSLLLSTLLYSGACASPQREPPGTARSVIVSGRADGYPPLFDVLPVAGFVLVPSYLIEEQDEPYGREWRRGVEVVWVGASRKGYPTFDGLGPQVEESKACRGRVAGVLKSFMLPARDGMMATDVLFFTTEGRAYQVGYSRPVKSEPAEDVLAFMSEFCGA